MRSADGEAGSVDAELATQRRTTPGPMTEAAGRVDAAYEPLDRAEFKRRTAETFPAVHLTTISVIQGVALGLLVEHVLPLTGRPQSWAPVLIYAVASFLIIITISFEYYYFVAVYRWSPKVPDTVIPFLLGVFEISAIYYLHNPRAWWLLTGCLAGVGVIAFSNTLINSRSTMFSETEGRHEGQSLYEYVHGYVLADIAISPANSRCRRWPSSSTNRAHELDIGASTTLES